VSREQKYPRLPTDNIDSTRFASLGLTELTWIVITVKIAGLARDIGAKGARVKLCF
jgi:hypothetical protein